MLDAQGRVLVANRALEQLLGVGVAGGLRGRALPLLAYAPDEELAREAVRQFEFMFKLIGEAHSSHEVLAAAVQTICRFTRSAMGQVWLPAGSVLVCSPSWCCSGYGFDKLHQASEERDYQLGEGLPALAWAKGQPLLLEDAGEPGRLERIARVAEELGPLVERRRATEALAASQRRFQSVTEAAVDAIVSADSAGRVLTSNGGAERMFGWTAEEIVGQPLTVIIPERFRQFHTDGIARLRRTAVSRLAGQVVELACPHRDGASHDLKSPTVSAIRSR